MAAGVTVGLWVRLEAKPGKEQELADFLRGGLALAEQEPATVAWFAVKLSPSTFGIFDVFPNDAGRQAHLNGRIAAALMARPANCSPSRRRSRARMCWRRNSRQVSGRRRYRASWFLAKRIARYEIYSRIYSSVVCASSCRSPSKITLPSRRIMKVMGTSVRVPGGRGFIWLACLSK